jgi:hypothetical protein
MRCPCCEVEAAWRPLHRHLADRHPELVRFEWREERSFYRVACPICGDAHEQAIKPRAADAAFLAEYEDEIRLVALDVLLNHLVGEHLGDPDTSPARPSSGEVI